MSITARTTGVDAPDAYLVSLSSVSGQSLSGLNANGSIVVKNLKAGTSTIELTHRTDGDIATALDRPNQNCNVSGANHREVIVTDHRITPEVFEVVCRELVRAEKIAFTAEFVLGSDRRQFIALAKPDGSEMAYVVTGK